MNLKRRGPKIKNTTGCFIANWKNVRSLEYSLMPKRACSKGEQKYACRTALNALSVRSVVLTPWPTGHYWLIAHSF